MPTVAPLSDGKEPGGTAPARLVRLLTGHGMTSVLVAMIVVLSFVSPSFIGVQNLLNVFRQVSVIAIVGIGVTLVIITTGIDLASGSVIALVSVIVASHAHPGQHALAVPILLGLGVGALTGAISGCIVAVGKIPAFIATLGMMIAARGAALLYSEGRPISDFSPGFDFIGRGSLLGVPFPIYVVGVTALSTHVLLTHTRFGRHVHAIGGNEQAAVVCGIDVTGTLVRVYTLAGMLSGIAGILLTARISVGQPTAGVGYELDAIAASVLGGTSLSGGVGTVRGTLVGALIMGVLNNGLDLLRVDPNWQQVIKGVLIVTAVLFDRHRRK